MPQNAPERDDLRYLIDPVCASCNDAGCAYCVDETNDLPPELRTADRLLKRDADLYNRNYWNNA